MSASVDMASAWVLAGEHVVLGVWHEPEDPSGGVGDPGDRVERSVRVRAGIPQGDAAVFTPRIDPTLGTVFATIGASGAAAAKGDGALLKLRLKSRQVGGAATLEIASLVGVDPGNRRLPVQGLAPLALKASP